MRANVDNLFQEAKMNNIRHKFQQICLFAYKDGKEKLIWKSQLLEKKSPAQIKSRSLRFVKTIEAISHKKYESSKVWFKEHQICNLIIYRNLRKSYLSHTRTSIYRGPILYWNQFLALRSVSIRQSRTKIRA